ncbi:MAG: thymidylate kinase [Evtepia sp.]
MSGTLIVLEGTDGCGKSTQFSKLCSYLERENKPVQRLVFPQYKEESSALIRMYLRGDFGSNPSDVNPYAASTFYAVDRYASFRKLWQSYYEQGGIVLADRYTTSNAVHQAAKLPKEARSAFFQWLFEFEYQRLGLPAPTLTLYLDLPTEFSLRLLRERESKTHTQADIHEANADYLAACHESALQVAAEYGWTQISCLDAKGVLRGIDDIHAEIINCITPYI